MSASSDPTTDLTALVHTGLQVPHTRLAVTALRQLSLHDGVAFTATLRHDRQVVGTIENQGTGGGTWFIPTHRATFGDTDLRAFADACRTAAGTVPTVEEILDDLVTEYDTSRAIRRAQRAGRTLLRLYDYIYDEHDQPFGEPIIHSEATAVPPTTDRARQALIAELTTNVPAGPHAWWRIWNGHAWDDLTPRPTC